MIRIEFAPETAGDFDRIFDHLLEYDAHQPLVRIGEIISALDVLKQNPMIGRPLRQTGMRELVIGRRTRGYVALYRYVPALDIVFVLAIRAQREVGYAHAFV